MRIRLVALTAALAILCVSALATMAHHSMATYDSSSPVMIKGKITLVEWRNPHAVVHLEVMGENGRLSSRQIEIAGPAALTRRKIDQSLLNVGKIVTIEAWLPKTGSGHPTGRTLILFDGRRLDVSDNWGLEVK